MLLLKTNLITVDLSSEEKIFRCCLKCALLISIFFWMCENELATMSYIYILIFDLLWYNTCMSCCCFVVGNSRKSWRILSRPLVAYQSFFLPNYNLIFNSDGQLFGQKMPQKIYFPISLFLIIKLINSP